MRCPSSVVRPSVRPSSVRPSSLTFHIFDFSSETTERNLTKLYKKVDLNVLYQVYVFRADRKNKMAALASDWLRHFRFLLWNRWMEFIETWQEARSQRPLPSLCFSGRSEKQDGRPGLWLAETFSTSPLNPLNRIQRNFRGKQDLNVLYQVCVFRTDRKNKMAALASDWLRHFRLLLWNHLTEFKETWQEARSQCPLPSLCFSGRSEKQDGLPGLWLAETFSTSPLKPLNRIQRNLTGSKISTSSTLFVFFWGRSEKQDGRPGLWLAETFSISPLKPLHGIQRNFRGSKISMSSTKFVFFRPIGKTRWPPWPLIGWDIFDFSSETAEQNSTKLDRKLDLNVLYHVCVFRPIGKTRWLSWPPIGWDISDFSSETAERNLKKLDRKQDVNVLYQVCVFWADWKNRMAALASD